MTQRPISADDRKAVVGSARLNNADQLALFNMGAILDFNNYESELVSAANSNTSNTLNPVAAKGGVFSSVIGGRAAKDAEKIASTANVSTLKIKLD